MNNNFIRAKFFCTSVSASNAVIKNKASDKYVEGYYPAFSASGQDVWLPTYEFTGNGIVLSAVGARCGKCFLAENKWAVCANTHVILIDENKCNIKYAYYLLNNESWWIKGGTAQPFILVKDSLNQKVYLPDMKTQIAIVDYLDKKSETIKTVISNLTSQIELLKEYKTSIMFEKTIMGLTCNEVKETSCPYIKTINKTFDLKPISSLFTIKKDIIGHDTDDVLSITQNGIVKKDISSNNGQLAESYENYQIVKKGDFAMNHMDLLTGWVDISKYDGVTSPDYRVFAIKNTISNNSTYFLNLFQTYYKLKTFYGFGQGVSFYGRWRVPAKNFLKMNVVVPSRKDQDEIVDYLNKETELIDSLISKKAETICKIEEYRQRLIEEIMSGERRVSL